MGEKLITSDEQELRDSVKAMIRAVSQEDYEGAQMLLRMLDATLIKDVLLVMTEMYVDTERDYLEAINDDE